MQNSPIFNKRIFWDIDPKSLDKQENKQFIIERILEFGDVPDIKWLENNFNKEEISKVLQISKTISVRTASFFKLFYHITEPILCLQNSYQKTQKLHWRL